jgi:hypothetical protein
MMLIVAKDLADGAQDRHKTHFFVEVVLSWLGMYCRYHPSGTDPVGGSAT